MSRKSASRLVRAKTTPAPPPMMPQHVLPEPYSRLLTLGDSDAGDLYDTIATSLLSQPAQAAEQLLAMVLDETWYDYVDGYEDEEYAFQHEPRLYTRLHALRVLMRLGQAAQIGMEPILPLLDEEDDELREEVPFYYAAMGEPAIEPLARVLNDTERDDWERIGAGTGLQQIGENHSELRPQIVALLERVLATEKESVELVSFLITDLMDLGSLESLPLIEQAFEEERVDEFIVSLDDVREHFGLPPLTPTLPEKRDSTEGNTESEATDRAASTPYVAAQKTGRNEPCPCGSGKKYKKCCGANA